MLVLEAPGPQEWTWDRDDAVQRLTDAYGAEAAEEISRRSRRLGAYSWTG